MNKPFNEFGKASDYLLERTRAVEKEFELALPFDDPVLIRAVAQFIISALNGIVSEHVLRFSMHLAKTGDCLPKEP